ncbi:MULTISPECIES: ABC transporter permease [unclassified Facklamia]|uniref:ABC transporter permease n=1 Tax=Aerococcaceae TaxID=186827 RepID=UPI0013BA76FB|nr:MULTISPECIES: ABC transporter permease [unclassified Facklamia]MBS4462454.1 ABC transporter permease [Aerococcaceae bacterium zg-B36]NEW65041.1 ABC transporter permease [Facklamia sp. 252]NEW68622.1 ABC transporter permease [Facklamia sp. 253]QQD65106.1 ABC transporter permease [Aerococcaceae bacterium zg-252]
MSKMWIVIKEVYRKNVLSGAFLAMVFGPILMFVVMGAIGYFVGMSKVHDSVGQIGLVHPSAEIQQVLTEADTGNEFHSFETDAQAAAALNAKEIDGYLVIDETAEPLSATFYRDKLGKDIEVDKFKVVLEAYAVNKRLVAEGIDAAKLASINSMHIEVNTTNVSFDENGNVKVDELDSSEKNIRIGIAFGVCFVVYMFIMTYISIISQEIATEKGSRIMEIVLSSISATKHFLGKMIGVGLVILTQVAIYLVLFLIANLVIRKVASAYIPIELIDNYVALGSRFSNDIALGALFALMGILTYTSIAGFLGSLVSRIEDISKMIGPLVLVGVVGFYIGMYALSSTNNPIVRIGSQIPFFTPFVMPFRIAAETVSPFEIVLSIIISLIFMVLCLSVSTIFYKSNVLVTSDKGLIQTFKRSYQLWRSERE